MKRPAKLSAADADTRLSALPGWTRRGKKLHRAFTFRDFSEAFGFMARVALCGREAEPPSGLDERMEPRHGGSQHARHRRPHGARLPPRGGNEPPRGGMRIRFLLPNASCFAGPSGEGVFLRRERDGNWLTLPRPRKGSTCRLICTGEWPRLSPRLANSPRLNHFLRNTSFRAERKSTSTGTACEERGRESWLPCPRNAWN